MDSSFYSFTYQSLQLGNTLHASGHRTGSLPLPITDLMYLQAYGNYTWLYWKDGRRMLIPRTLKYFLPYIPNDWFTRLHRNCIVNIHYIERMESIGPNKGGNIHLTSGTLLLVSRRRWCAAKKQIAKYKLGQLNR